MPDKIGDIAAELTKQELGIKSDTRLSKDLTPISDVSDSFFVRGRSFSLSLREKEAAKPATPEHVQAAKEGVELYNEHLSMRDSEGNKSNTRKIVGKVEVSPAGPEGRHIVNFTTTNFAGENDWRAWATSMMFDEKAENLNNIYPAREKHWLVAKKGDDRLSVRYEEFHQKTDGKVAETLVSEGWENIREYWAMDVDRWAGTLTPPAKEAE